MADKEIKTELTEKSEFREILGRFARQEPLFAAERKDTPKGLLEEFSKDENPLVRRLVAENPNTPTRVLHKLIKDQDSSVRGLAAKQVLELYKSKKITLTNKQLLDSAIAASDNNLDALRLLKTLKEEVTTNDKS